MGISDKHCHGRLRFLSGILWQSVATRQLQVHRQPSSSVVGKPPQSERRELFLTSETRHNELATNFFPRLSKGSTNPPVQSSEDGPLASIWLTTPYLGGHAGHVTRARRTYRSCFDFQRALPAFLLWGEIWVCSSPYWFSVKSLLQRVSEDEKKPVIKGGAACPTSLTCSYTMRRAPRPTCRVRRCIGCCGCDGMKSNVMTSSLDPLGPWHGHRFSSSSSPQMVKSCLSPGPTPLHSS